MCITVVWKPGCDVIKFEINLNPFIAQKFSVFGVILVRIFPAFSRNRSISPYSVRMREKAEKMRTRITPNTYSLIQDQKVKTKT